jgi:hypothetical protein
MVGHNIPTLRPRAFRNVNVIAPPEAENKANNCAIQTAIDIPISSLSTFASKEFRTGILVETYSKISSVPLLYSDNS